MTNQIIRSNGITYSERYLQKLCEKSFLRLWSYPGVYRNQSAGGGSQGGKELCDLLVVFENHILIFSDKDILFPNTGDLDVDWSRWVRKAVLESGEQLYGAERWIKEHPDRLYIDRKCQQPFPIDLPDIRSARIHRIIIAHGASERCKHELGGSGSLMIFSDICGKDHLAKREIGGIPFAIGQIDPQRGYVHIFDDTTLDIVMNTLDTIYDFTTYLDKKEQLFDRNVNVIAAGEEELLAYYLRELNDDGEHDFNFPDNINAICVDEGHWEDFIRSAERRSQIEENKISYAWDDLIEEFSTHIINDTQYIKDPLGPRNQEKVMRHLAREPRTRRRMLSKGLFELLEKTPVSYKAVRVNKPSKPGDPYIVFLLLPHLQEITEEEYRELRYYMLRSYCMVVKHDFPDALDIVGIATETGTGDYRSEDAIYLDTRIWTSDQETEAISLKNDLDLLKKTKRIQSTEYEYPIYATKSKNRKRHKPKTHM